MLGKTSGVTIKELYQLFPRARPRPPPRSPGFPKRHEHIKIATVGNPGLHLATLAGGLPGMPGLMTRYMERKMDKLDIPPIPEFIEMIADTGPASTAARHPATCSG